jgi:hypothetical protein
MGILFFVDKAGRMCKMFGELTRLFGSPIRIKLLKFFSLQPESKVTAAQVPRLVGANKEQVRTELRALARSGLLLSKVSREGTGYQWNESHRLAPAIAEFLDSAAVPKEDEIASQFKKIPSVIAVIAAGTLVRETRSSVDLLVLSRQPNDDRVAQAVKKLEISSAMPIRFAVMAQREFDDRRESYDRLLRDVLDFKYKVVYGKILGL